MNEALEMIEHHAIDQGLSPSQVRDRFLAGDMAARVLMPPSQLNGRSDLRQVRSG